MQDKKFTIAFFLSFCFLSPLQKIFLHIFHHLSCKILWPGSRCCAVNGHTGKCFRQGYFNYEISYMQKWHTMFCFKENSNNRFKYFQIIGPPRSRDNLKSFLSPPPQCLKLQFLKNNCKKFFFHWRCRPATQNFWLQPKKSVRKDFAIKKDIIKSFD